MIIIIKKDSDVVKKTCIWQIWLLEIFFLMHEEANKDGTVPAAWDSVEKYSNDLCELDVVSNMALSGIF